MLVESSVESSDKAVDEDLQAEHDNLGCREHLRYALGDARDAWAKEVCRLSGLSRDARTIVAVRVYN